MATAPPDPTPFDAVRDAFAGLETSAKAAFVLEATFETIGQALAETGRRAATVLDDLDIDDWFVWDEDDEATPEAPPAATASKAPAAKKAPAKKPAAKKTTATKPSAKKAAPKPPGKTAGKAAPRRRPPSDDAA